VSQPTVQRVYRKQLTAHPIQDRRTDVQGSPRHNATVPWTTRPSSRSARSAATPLCQLQSPGGDDVPTVYSR